jgi:hypothetical protein
MKETYPCLGIHQAEERKGGGGAEQGRAWSNAMRVIRNALLVFALFWRRGFHVEDVLLKKCG